MLWVIVWLGLSILAGVVASQKGRSGGGFFLLALVLSPIIGLLAALVVAPNQAHQEQTRLASGQGRKCPFCAEIIRPEATVCRYCGRELRQPEVRQIDAPPPPLPVTSWSNVDVLCVSCGKSIPSDMVRCRYCGNVQPVY